MWLVQLFQSTLSVRRATIVLHHQIIKIAISIHALRKESDLQKFRTAPYAILISIHALRKESDLPVLVSAAIVVISIHALRKESDHGTMPERVRTCISIHALRKESDAMRCVSLRT